MQHTMNRRAILRDGLLLSSGVAAGMLLPTMTDSLSNNEASAADDGKTPEQRLKELGIELPPAPKPIAVYVPAVRVGEMLHTSGHGPRRADGTVVTGRVGDDLTLEHGHEAARLVGLNVLSSVRATLGSLDKVVRLVKVLGMVNSTSDFTQHPKVINGFSELMVEVFGEEAGKGARSAVGMGSLPRNIPVEIEAIFQVS